jgi:hypothetical protein
MKYFLVILLLFIIVIFGSRHRFKKKRNHIVPRYVMLTGTEFILLGYLLGESGLNYLDTGTLEQLQPVLAFALGWIGLIFGIQFDRHQLAKLPTGYIRFSLLQGALTCLLLSLASMVGGWILFRQYGGLNIVIISLVVGGTAACSTQVTPSIVARELKVKPHALIQFIKCIAAIDGIVGIFLIGIAFCFIPGLTPRFEWMYPPWMWFVFSICLGVLLGFIFKSLTFYRFSQDELLLVLFGITTFSGGIAFFLHLSPLFITFIMGLLVANLSRDSSRILEFLTKAEHLAYVCILLFAGASLVPLHFGPIIIGLVYFVLRFAGKLAGNFVAGLWAPVAHSPPPYLGAALIAQGGMAVALTVSLQYQYPTPVTATITSAIIIGIICSEIIGPVLLITVLQARGGSI